ncbi:probable G-protein coupled receptor Mth-like 3 [Harmonia axyridis]|uniref:probable G-protein coupled receptor Mth-like 3 n=1 Tax=Harmonia axyridis TaxID=115357 RepID=UPI001E275FB4|nr:probable G-protein coupled receptor Mth-like 3 [Harmonia axyridis]
MKGKYEFLLLLTLGLVQSQPCHHSVSVDISDGDIKWNGEISKDGVLYSSSNYYRKDNTIFGCPCNLKKCVRKCCAVDEIMENKTCTKSELNVFIPIHEVDNFLYNLDMKNGTHKTSDLFYIHNLCTRRIRLEPGDVFYLQPNGSLLVPDFELDAPLKPHEYCLDVFKDDTMDNMFSALICVEETTEEKLAETTRNIYSTGVSLDDLAKIDVSHKCIIIPACMDFAEF